MVIKKCVNCGKEFDAKRNTKFCSKECREALIICAECGKKDIRNNTNKNGQYICKSCYDKQQYQIKKNKIIKCAECGKEDQQKYKNSKEQYICQSCYLKKYAPKKEKIKCAECGHICYSGYVNQKGQPICSSCDKKRREKIKCVECGKEDVRNYKNKNGQYICKSCYNIQYVKNIINQNKEEYNNLNTQKDIDLFIFDMKKQYPYNRVIRQIECELLGYGNYNEAMNQAEKRDNYTCQITGKKGNIVVHHLNSYNTHKELACDLDNLITLDRNFHDAFHNKYGYGDNTAEQFWEFVEEYKKGLVILDDFYDSNS